MNSAALHQAIYSRLSSFAPLTSLLSPLGVMSRVPQPDDAGDASDFPYVTFNLLGIEAWDTQTTDGGIASLQVNVWSRSETDLPWRAIQDAVYDCLHRFDLVVAGANTVNCLFEQADNTLDPDGITMHGISIFNISYDGI